MSVERTSIHLTVTASPDLRAAKWARDDLVLGLLKATEPPGYISREDAEALADAIIEATGDDAFAPTPPSP